MSFWKDAEVVEVVPLLSPEIWEVEPHLRVGPIRANLSRDDALNLFGESSDQREFIVGTSITWGQADIEILFAGPARLWDVTTLSQRTTFSLAGIALKGGIANLAKKLNQSGFSLDPVMQGFDVRGAGVSLFIPIGTRTVRSVTVTLGQGELPENCFVSRVRSEAEIRAYIENALKKKSAD